MANDERKPPAVRGEHPAEAQRQDIGSRGFSGMEPGANVNELAGEPNGEEDYFEGERPARSPEADADDDEASHQRPPAREDKGDRDA